MLLGASAAYGQNGRGDDDKSGSAGTSPRAPAGSSGGSTRAPAPKSGTSGGTSGGSGAPSGGGSAGSSGDSDSGTTTPGRTGGPATRSATGAGRAQPATTNPRLRDRLYNNVRHPGGTYSTQPLSPEQDLDRPLPQTGESATDEAFLILGSEDFDGFTAYAVNDADLFLSGLTDAQRALIRVVRAGEFGNPYDLILVDDSVGVDIYVFVEGYGGHGIGAGEHYYEGGGPYYTSDRFYGYWGVYPWGYPSAHAARWGFAYGYGFGYGGSGYSPHRYYSYPYGYSYDGYPRYWGPIDSSYSAGYQSPQQVSPGEEIVVELTALELAQVLLSAGYVEEAIESYRAHLQEDPEDTIAMRVLGAAFIEKGEIGDGFALVRLAYGTDPALAIEPMDATLFGSAKRLREVVRKAVRAANKEDSASAWLSVTMLMQAEGRDRVALKNLAKAEREYLSEDIARALRQRLE